MAHRNCCYYTKNVLMIALAGTLLSGCGSRVRGTYAGGNFFDKLDFKSAGKVDITFMTMTKEGTFELDGDKVKVKVGADTQVFTIDSKGCLDGGGLLGTYCKGESSSGGAGKDLAGTYKAGDAAGGITLNFERGQRVRMMISERGSRPDTAEGTYKLDGDKVTISVPGGMPLMLRRRGNQLQGAFGGRAVTFARQ